jgi:catechol 2,3-dioxygenase-like lactoylglutathione lyase family enzyme
MVNRIRHCCIVTNDLKKSLHFYTHILDLKITEHTLLDNINNNYLKSILGLEKLEYIKLRTKRNKTLLEIYYFAKIDHILLASHVPHYTFNHISFSVSNIRKLYKDLIKNGYKPLSKPQIDILKQNYVMFVRDPDNNLLEFVEELKGEKNAHSKISC